MDFVQRQHFWRHTVRVCLSSVLQLTEGFARNWQRFCANVTIENAVNTHPHPHTRTHPGTHREHSNNRFKCCSSSLGLRALPLLLNMTCTTYIHLQDLSSSGTSSIFKQEHKTGVWEESPELDFSAWWIISVSQIVDVGADLEGGTELDVHGRHEMFLLQQQKGLSINLLWQELGGELLTAYRDEREDKHK